MKKEKFFYEAPSQEIIGICPEKVIAGSIYGTNGDEIGDTDTRFDW